MEAAARSGCAHWTGWETKTYNSTHNSNQACTHTVTQTCSLADSETNHATQTHAHKNRPNTHFQREKNKKAVQTHSHIAFPSTVQLTRLKKKHKNKLHRYFLPSRFSPPCFLVSCGVVFSKSVFLLCSAGGLGVVPCPLGLCTHALTRAASHLASRSMRHPSLKVKKVTQPPVKVIPESTLSCPLFITESIRGPIMKTSGGMSVCVCLNKLFRGQGQKEGVLHVYAYLCAYSCVCTVCVCI